MTKKDVQVFDTLYTPEFVRKLNNAYNPYSAICKACVELEVSAVDWMTTSSVKITFSAPVLDNVALRNIDNYVFTPHSPVVDPRAQLPVLFVTPELLPSPTFVTLTTGEQTDGQTYDLDIKTIEAA